MISEGTLTHEITVRFHEIDRAGIVYFSRFYEYCHIAFEELLMALLGNLEAFWTTATWGMPLVHSEADYQAPSRFGDRLEVHLEVEKLGERSITFAYRITGEEGDLRATAKLVHAFVDLRSFESLPAPPEVREGLARLGIWPKSGD